MKKFQLDKGLNRREAFGQLLKQTHDFDAFTYDPETGVVVTEPKAIPPTLKEKVMRFTSNSRISFEDISGAPDVP